MKGSLQPEGLSLDEDAGGGELFSCVPIWYVELLDMGHEVIVRIFFGQAFKEAQPDLGRKAERRGLSVKGRLHNLVRRYDLAPQLGEEVVVEGKDPMDGKGCVDADTGRAGIDFSGGHVLFKKQLPSNLDQIKMIRFDLLLQTYVVVAIAGAAKGVEISLDADPLDLTLQVTLLLTSCTGEGFFVVDLSINQAP